MHDYSWDEMLVRWIVAPLPYHLWFLRVLFFYNLAYPWLRDWVIGATSRRVFFSVAILFWLGGGSLFFLEGEGLLFFSLGVWMQKFAFDIETPRRWSDPRTWGLVLVGAAALKTSLAFAGIGLIGDATRPVLVLLHKLTSASGLIAAWFGGDAIVRWCMRRCCFVWLTSFSFFIYAAHAPWVAIAIDPVLRELGAVPGRRLLTFVVLPSAILALTVLVGAALRALTPTAYGALTGDAGSMQLRRPRQRPRSGTERAATSAVSDVTSSLENTNEVAASMNAECFAVCALARGSQWPAAWHPCRSRRPSAKTTSISSTNVRSIRKGAARSKTCSERFATPRAAIAPSAHRSASLGS